MTRHRDLLFGVALLAVAELETLAAGDSLAFACAIPFFTLTLAWRVSHALSVTVVASVAILASALVDPGQWDSIAAVAAILAVAYSAGAHEPRGRAVAAIAALGAGVAAQELLVDVDTDLLFGWIVFGAAWLGGRGVRARRRQAERLAELTERLRAEREANARLAVTEGRLRIARDLHDSVAGMLNVMVIQAAAAEQSLDRAPDRAAAAVSAVQASGREAAAELTRMLELLGGGTERQPQPGLERLDELIAFARAAGVDVRLELEGERPLPAGVELSAYRIVQEALTNVVKHAGGARTLVRLRFEPDQLWIEVANEGRLAGTAGANGGHGLINMRERAALFGGELTAAPGGDGGFRVEARLPVA